MSHPSGTRNRECDTMTFTENLAKIVSKENLGEGEIGEMLAFLRQPEPPGGGSSGPA